MKVIDVSNCSDEVIVYINDLQKYIGEKEKEIQDLKQKNDYFNDLEASSVEYKELQNQLQQKENIIKEVRESAKRELKIAEENIKNSKQWLDVEEEQEHAKRDIHTGKMVKRYMEMFLEILDKENK